MDKRDQAKELLKDKRVIDEINRHKWIESEKSGRDIGFERAAEDWIERFSDDWMRHHTPDKYAASRFKNIKKQQLSDH